MRLNRNLKINLIAVAILLFTYSVLTSCSNTRYLKPGQVLYTGAVVKVNPDSAKKVDNQKQLVKDLEGKTRPAPNKSILGLKFKLFIYNLAGEPTKPKGFRHWLRTKVGEPPVLLSDVKLKYNTDVLKSYLISKGYLQAAVTGDTVVKNKKGKAIYTANTDIRYKINRVTFPPDTGNLTTIIQQTSSKSLVKPSNFYDLETFKNERLRIDNELKERGYFYFNPDFIIMQVDSTIGKNLTNVNVRIKNTSPVEALKPYRINNINIFPNYNLRRDSVLRASTPTAYKDFNIYDSRNTFKPKVFDRLVFFSKGETYNRKDHNQSLNRMVNLNTFQDVRMEFIPHNGFKDDILDLNIYLTPLKKNSLTFSVTGTNKSNNFIGSEVKLTQTTRNLFRGAEQLDVSVSGGFETQYSGRTSGINSYSLTTNGKLTFPRFIIPFFKFESTTAFIPKTIISLTYQLLKRDSLYTLNSFKAEYGYNWKENQFKEHNLNPFVINLVKPNKGDSSKLADLEIKNPGISKSLQKQFILGSTYNFTYTDQTLIHQRNNIYFFGSIETSGNLLGLFNIKNSAGERTLFGQPLTQFVRIETDLRDYYKINRKVTWVNRLNLGYGYAYGNSTSMPFIRQFFAGGSSDVRAFRARSLGPGTYKIPDDIAYADQSGDVKALFNSELRFKLVSIFEGAAFVDAGNIWLRKADDRVGSGFKLKNALSEMAVGTGLGLRVDAKIFVIRLDGAFPLRKPYLPAGNRWVLNQIDFGSKSWRKDNLILNIGIGYPF